MDWKNKHEMVANKIKGQLHARGHDTLAALHRYFQVSQENDSGIR